jgi:predicted ArsR family transcriptional regulator
MDVASQTRDDPLSLPVRAELFEALVELRRPASTPELARRLDRHHNTVRRQLARLAEAGLVECRTVRRTRGRPHHEWVIARDAMPGGRAPEAYADLGRWLARAVGRGGGLDAVEATGREIGREIAPDGTDRPLADSMRDVLTALGFAPRQDGAADRGGARYVLANCPYRDAVRENQPAVCTLHRGITRGLLDRLAPGGELVEFVARDPDAAGCVIGIATDAAP